MAKINTGAKIRDLQDKPIKLGSEADSKDLTFADVAINEVASSDGNVREKMHLLIKLSKENADIEISIDEQKLLKDVLTSAADKPIGKRYFNSILVYGRALEILEGKKEETTG